MKKAKVMLAAVAIFAVVGGSLAFKAAKMNTETFYTSTAFPGVGTLELNTIYSTDGTGVSKIFSDITLTSGSAVVRTMELSSTE